ncbi:two-component system response regulator [Aliikangiella sp. IMCC44359]|uniref:two-component system response regulator n=1 Tax=Aliikangiella sp. IMCC44359 TaxID=3459125 RepID=UPI00403A8A87
MNILIIDDNEIDREVVKRTLFKANIACSFEETNSVDKGLSMLRCKQFDLVLLDYLMPEKDGIELLIELKNDPLPNATAIVMLSEFEQEKLAIDCLNAGAQDFLVKSKITASQLWRSIVHAKVRFELEKRLVESYQYAKNLSEYDALTGLLNRLSFDKARQIAITGLPRKKMIALVLFDIDNFKFINDTYGHLVGDELLKQIVRRVQGSLRGYELFARLGGDEFALMLSNIERFDDASMIAQRIQGTFIKPFIVENNSIQSSCSIGISFYPYGNNSSEELIKYADIALYRAKKIGKSQICFFEESMQVKFVKNFKVEQDLKLALANQEFHLEYQPIYNINTNLICGFEALIRWSKNQTILYPDEFIPIAEQSNIIIEVGRWALKEAISQLSFLKSEGYQNLKMAVNISFAQLSDLGLVEFINGCLQEFNVNAEDIELEMTETALLSEYSTVNQCEVVHDLNRLGCSIALDDFGTGYSSVSYLQKFPIDRVKIDKSLTVNFEKSQTKKLIHALVKMLCSLNIKITIEGAESKSCIDFCQSLGVQNVQGFYLSKPVHPTMLLELLKDKG